MQFFQNVLAYFVTAVSYCRKMFMNLKPACRWVEKMLEQKNKNKKKKKLKKWIFENV